MPENRHVGSVPEACPLVLQEMNEMPRLFTDARYYVATFLDNEKLARVIEPLY